METLDDGTEVREYTTEGAVEVDKAVTTALLKYSVPESEIEAFMLTLFPPHNGPVTYESYKRFLNNLRSRFPKLASTVLMLLDGTPSEASVERAFSHMKWFFGDLRERPSDAVHQVVLELSGI